MKEPLFKEETISLVLLDLSFAQVQPVHLGNSVTLVKKQRCILLELGKTSKNKSNVPFQFEKSSRQ